MANRIPPPDPETQRLSQAKKLEEAQKVAAISSVDPDAQAKKRRFKEMMNEPEKDDKNEEAQAPSPFQPSFHQKPSDFDLEEIPAPYNSQPPNVNAPSPPVEDLLSDKGLPQSPEYWNQVDLPDQPIETTPQFTQDRETLAKEPLQKGKPVEKPLERQKNGEIPSKKMVEPSPFGLPGKPAEKKGLREKERPPFAPKGEEKPVPVKKKESEVPLSKYWSEEPVPPSIQGNTPLPKEKEKRQERPTAAPITHNRTPLDQAQPPPQREFSPLLQKGDSGEKGGRERESKPTLEIIPPASPGFTPSTHFEAVSAATAATPYLRSETFSLFYQMVGTIFTMSEQGVSRTEILLNNPAFAGSKFFGASIEIIKYSSAPDSFNIRLTGSNEAVTAFNQNIPGLIAAFQTGGFRFRVGRIEAAYATEKPLFRRKEGKGDHTSGEKKEEER